MPGIAIDITRSPGFNAICWTRRLATPPWSSVSRGCARTATEANTSESRAATGRITAQLTAPTRQFTNSPNSPTRYDGVFMTGTEALRRGAWAEARAAFETALDAQVTPEA